MSAVCEHVPYDASEAVAVVPGRPSREHVEVRCPCCGLTAWREPEDDLDGDNCPYCGVQAVPVMTETVDQRVLWDAAEVGQEGPPMHGQPPCFESDPETGMHCCRAAGHEPRQHVATAAERGDATTVVAVWPVERP